MKRFAAMHDWPLLTMRALTRGLHRRVEIRGRHDDERIAAAELEHALLDPLRRVRRHARAGRLAAGERRRFHALVVEQRARPAPTPMSSV